MAPRNGTLEDIKVREGAMGDGEQGDGVKHTGDRGRGTAVGVISAQGSRKRTADAADLNDVGAGNDSSERAEVGAEGAG